MTTGGRSLRALLLVGPVLVVCLALLTFVHEAFGWAMVVVLIAGPLLRVAWITVGWVAERDRWFMAAGIGLISMWIIGTVVSLVAAR